jgi:adenylylsulfate kinase
MTGLSGSGKSTIAEGAAEQCDVEILDGDSVRQGLCSNLGFSGEDRRENLRRIAHLAEFLNKYTDVIVACITPYESVREMVRSICTDVRVVYIDASLSECEKRDPKGLYARARRGEISGMTGIDDPFEAPQDPDLILDTEKHSPEQCTGVFVRYMRDGSICEDKPGNVRVATAAGKRDVSSE